LSRAAVELAQEWRTDRALRHLEAFLLATDGKSIYLLSGTGDVIEPDDGVLAVGSGGVFALAAARALLRHTKLPARKIAQESLKIASEICVFTNSEISLKNCNPTCLRRSLISFWDSPFRPPSKHFVLAITSNFLLFQSRLMQEPQNAASLPDG
jgi:hypothetical protein